MLTFLEYVHFYQHRARPRVSGRNSPFSNKTVIKTHGTNIQETARRVVFQMEMRQDAFQECGNYAAASSEKCPV